MIVIEALNLLVVSFAIHWLKGIIGLYACHRRGGVCVSGPIDLLQAKIIHFHRHLDDALSYLSDSLGDSSVYRKLGTCFLLISQASS